jgi:hypothetical protein
LPDLIYFNELVKDAAEEANLFVPSENCGGTPAKSSAGRLISPPPPAIESTKAAIKPAIHKNIIVITTNPSPINFIIFSSHYLALMSGGMRLKTWKHDIKNLVLMIGDHRE